MNQKNKVEDQIVKIRKELSMIKEDFLKVDIVISVFGIRELISPAKNPIITFTLTTRVGGEKKI